MARFKMSNCVAFESAKPERAASLYSQILGVEVLSTGGDIEVDTGPMRFFFDRGESEPAFEFLVDDLDGARAELERLGFTVARWEGNGKPCYMRDPNGLLVNLYFDPAAFA